MMEGRIDRRNDQRVAGRQAGAAMPKGLTRARHTLS
jgi:hypothetical protein